MKSASGDGKRIEVLRREKSDKKLKDLVDAQAREENPRKKSLKRTSSVNQVRALIVASASSNSPREKGITRWDSSTNIKSMSISESKVSINSRGSPPTVKLIPQKELTMKEAKDGKEVTMKVVPLREEGEEKKEKKEVKDEEVKKEKKEKKEKREKAKESSPPTVKLTKEAKDGKEVTMKVVPLREEGEEKKEIKDEEAKKERKEKKRTKKDQAAEVTAESSPEIARRLSCPSILPLYDEGLRGRVGSVDSSLSTSLEEIPLVKKSLWNSLKNSLSENKKPAKHHVAFIDLKVMKISTDDIFSKPLATLPCHTDLPRLVNKVVMKDLNYTEESPVATKIQQLFLEVSTRLDTPEVIERIYTQLPNFFDSLLGSDALEVALKKFILEVVRDDSITGRVLKTVTQSFVAPIVVHMKKNVGEIFPFNSKKGGWSITIGLKNEKQVEITHEREETSPNTAAPFSFKWRARFCFDREMTELQELNLDVIDVFAPDKRKQKELHKILEKCFGKHQVTATLRQHRPHRSAPTLSPTAS